MAAITINNRNFEIRPGQTILDVCRDVDIRIPTMCHLEGAEHFTSCMVCVVWERKSGRLLPACSAPAQDGMEIDTDNEKARNARRDALELLLREHVGDCEAPCRRGCPAHMDIPLMLRQIKAGQNEEALRTVKRHIPLPAVLGRICPAPCEKVCRRAQQDEPVAICREKRFVADMDLASAKPYIPEKQPDSGKKVAVIGAGPAGLSAAYYLSVLGHTCTVYEKGKQAGGALRSIDKSTLPETVLDAEIELIKQLGANFILNQEIGPDIPIDDLHKQYDVVIIASGASDNTFAVDRHTLATDTRGIFAAGNAIRTSKMAVRSVGQGRTAAFSADRYLRGMTLTVKDFDSRLHNAGKDDLPAFMQKADSRAQLPSTNDDGSYEPQDAAMEAARCMHCDCRKSNSCTLRDLAVEYDANADRYLGEDRLVVERCLQHTDIVYEPGKCIKCGICVRITEKQAEPLGLTFIGRGFNVNVDAPFDSTLDRALQKTALQCADACPTGALARRQSRTT